MKNRCGNKWGIFTKVCDWVIEYFMRTSPNKKSTNLMGIWFSVIFSLEKNIETKHDHMMIVKYMIFILYIAINLNSPMLIA